MSSECQKPPCPKESSQRQEILSQEGVGVLDTRGEEGGEGTIDLVTCALPGKYACFAVLYWGMSRLIEADLYFTEAEARIRFARGRTLVLEDFALPPPLLACL